MADKNTTPQSNVPSFDDGFFSGLSTGTMKDAEDTKFGGPTICIIREAVVGTTEGGSRFLQLVVEAEHTGKKYQLSTLYLTKKDGSENEKDMKRLKQIAYMCGMGENERFIIQQRMSEFQFEGGQKVSKPMPMISNLIDKRVGLSIAMQEAYKNVAVNGYSGSPIPSYVSDPDAHNEAKKSPETIYVPNMEKTKLEFTITKVFNPATDQSFNEISKSLPAVEIQKLRDEWKGNKEIKAYTDAELLELRKKTLQDSLEKAGIAFDENLWQSANFNAIQQAQATSGGTAPKTSSTPF